jgi:hypothetical protein
MDREGIRSATRMAIIAITTESSIRVKPWFGWVRFISSRECAVPRYCIDYNPIMAFATCFWKEFLKNRVPASGLWMLGLLSPGGGRLLFTLRVMNEQRAV